MSREELLSIIEDLNLRIDGLKDELEKKEKYIQKLEKELDDVEYGGLIGNKKTKNDDWN